MSEIDEETVNPSTNNGLPEEPTKSYAGWVTACAFAAISTLFGVLWQVQTSRYNTAREDLREEKTDSKSKRKSDSIVIAKMMLDNEDCEEKALDDLERKLKRAESIKFSVFSDYNKVSKELESAKQDVKTIVASTKEVNKVIKASK